jgi:hypothetical protein
MDEKAIRAAKLTLGGMLEKRRASEAKDRAGGQIAPSKYLPNVPRQAHAYGGYVPQAGLPTPRLAVAQPLSAPSAPSAAQTLAAIASLGETAQGLFGDKEAKPAADPSAGHHAGDGHDHGSPSADRGGMSEAALSAWGRLTDAYGQPLTVTSAYRDPKRNEQVGGANNSQHMHGNAYDVDVSHLSYEDRIALADQAWAAGFRGIGFYDNSMHFDVADPRAWGPSYSSDSIPDWAADWTAQRYGYADGGEVTDLGQVRQQKQLEGFHGSLMGDIEQRVSHAMEAHQKAVDAGVFDGYELGDVLQGSAHPMRITGRFMRLWKPTPMTLQGFDRMGAKPTIIEHEGKQYIPMLRYETGVEDQDGFQRGDAYLDGIKAAGYQKMGGLRAVKADGGSVGIGGIEAYHGSPHDFDRFDIGRIGTGEGAAAFGHGLYFAGDENIARYYRDRINLNQNKFDIVDRQTGKPIPEDAPGYPKVKDFMNAYAYDLKAGDIAHKKGWWAAQIPHTERQMKEYQDYAASTGNPDMFKDEIEQMRADLAHYKAAPALVDRVKAVPRGHMYKVNLGVGEHELLDWDKKLGEQHPEVQRKLRDVLKPTDDADWANWLNSGVPRTYRVMGWPDAASKELYEAGIKGIRYLDANSRGSGRNSYNYVMFHHDPVSVVKKYAYGGSVDGGAVPQKTVKAYKLFRTKGDGNLYPLFVNADKPVPIGEWLEAEEGPQGKAQGKVKSKLGDLAYRPGWHAGDLPVATHIGGKSDPSLKKPDYRPDNHVWAEVEMAADKDWQSVADRRGKGAKAHITDQVPLGGFYRYKTNPNMTGNWLIGGNMKVNRVLSDDEVKAINDAAGTADLPRLPRGAFAAGGAAMFEGIHEDLQDEQGNPLELWHGTPEPHEFEAFDDKKLGSARDYGFYGRGHYLTPDAEAASEYAGSHSEEGTLMGPLHAALKNPYIWDTSSENAAHRTLRDLQSMGVMKGQSKLESWDNLQRHHIDPFMQEMRRRGHDGVVVRTQDYGGDRPHRVSEVVVFKPTAIKHAEAEVFDPTDPRIRRSTGGAAYDAAMAAIRRNK